jgi:hypothetical protein
MEVRDRLMFLYAHPEEWSKRLHLMNEVDIRGLQTTMFYIAERGRSLDERRASLFALVDSGLGTATSEHLNRLEGLISAYNENGNARGGGITSELKLMQNDKGRYFLGVSVGVF